MNVRVGRRARIILAGIAWCLSAAPAAAIINPDFTPRHLAEQSEVIVAGTLARGAAAGTWLLAQPTVLKGRAEAGYTFSTEQCDPDHAPQITELLTTNQAQAVMLFAGTLNGGTRSFLHTGGSWLESEVSADRKRWWIKRFATSMAGTYEGGSDQLVRMMRYLTKDPDACVPVCANVRWTGDRIRVGKAPGAVAGLAGVQLGQAGTWHVFCASPAGDSLFRAETVEQETLFKDVSSAAGVTTKSAWFAWCDLNGDGLADLVSSDGKTLTVCFGKKDGALAAAGREWSVTLETGCIGLTPCGMGAAPGVLVTSQSGPLLLLAQGTNGWKKMELPRGNATMASGALVADFDGDGYADVLVPGHPNGLLWKGGAEGFAKPVACALGTGGETVRCAMGDFNQDGAMDVFVAGTSRCWLWENDGRGNFKDVLRFAGAPSYKCKPGAADVRTLDLNHDGCPDLCLAYAQGSIVYYFNRGFRSLAEEGEVKLPGLLGTAGSRPPGVVAVATGDFDSNSSMDLVVATAGNEIFCYLNEAYSRPGMLLRLPAGAAAPLTVSAWQGDVYATTCGSVVVPDALGTYLSLRAAGNVTLQWTEPGRGVRSQSIVVENKTRTVTLP